MKQRTENLLAGLLCVILLAIAIVIFSEAAYAGGDMKGDVTIKKYEGNTWDNSTTATATTGDIDVDVSTGMEFNAGDTVLPDDIKIRNTASADVPNLIASSGTCRYSISGGFGVPGANIGGGKAKQDRECDKREAARVIGSLGYKSLALGIMCRSEAVVDTIGTDMCDAMVLVQDENDELRRRIELLLDEREMDRLRCNEAKDRIMEGCYK